MLLYDMQYHTLHCEIICDILIYVFFLNGDSLSVCDIVTQ